MPGQTHVVCAGLATYDVVHLVDGLPGPDTKVAALDFFTAAGGPAANAAIACAHLGASPTLVTALPEHPVSALITADLEQHGVDVSVVAAYPGAPITASIMVTKATGERAIVSPTSSATDSALDATAGPELHNTLCVLVDGYFRSLSLPIAREARKRGIPVILDAGSFKHYSAEVLREIDVAIVSAAFVPPGTDGSARAVFDFLNGLGVEWCAITRGAGPIDFMTPRGSGTLHVSPVDAVDTLGAGDFFHGALAYRIASLGLDAERFSADLAFAARVAAASLTSFGTRAWLESPPSW